MPPFKVYRLGFITFIVAILTPLSYSSPSSVSKPLILAQTQDDRKAEAESFNQQAHEQLKNNQPRAAIESWEKARIIYQEINDLKSEALMLGNIGIMYRGLGEYEKALEILNEVLIRMQNLNELMGQSRALQQLGLLHSDLGNYNQALNYFNQQIEIAKAIPSRAEEAGAYGNIGLVYLERDEYQQALQNINKHLEIAQEIDNIDLQKIALSNLALIYVWLGEYEEAQSLYAKLQALAKDQTDQDVQVQALESRALMYRAQRQHHKAIELFKQQFEQAKAWGDRRVMAVALNNLGVSLYEIGRVAEAERTLYNAIEIQESLLDDTDPTNEVSIFGQYAQPYIALQQVLVSQKKFKQALEIAERGRTRPFVRLLTQRLSNQTETQLATLSPTFEQLQQIATAQNATFVEYSVIPATGQLFIWVLTPTGKFNFHRVDLACQQTLIPYDDCVTKPLQAFIQNTRESVVKEGAIASAAPGRGIPDSPSFAVGDLVRQKDDLPDSEPARVEAIDSEKQTLTLSHSQWNGKEITVLMANVIKVESQRTSNQELKQLYQLLIEPIVEILPKDPESRVIFIPQGELFLVPFPALQDASGKYLIENHTILTAPSIQVLDSTRKMRQQVLGSAENVLVVGNPSPMPQVSLIQEQPPEQLSPLPNAETEANIIAQLFNTTPLTGTQATKAAIVPQLANARIIHFATHGLLDNRNGLASAIALAPSAKDNGLLTAEEILNMKLSAELVVLSACNTGSGYITGDGVIGLSRSLIAAGTPSVIVSLWSVSDPTTTELMTEFYQQWLKNPDKAKALRQAMLTSLQKHPQPRDWAAFTLIGEAE